MPSCLHISHSNSAVCTRSLTARWLAAAAVSALMDEADLTPKPGLVDTRSSGAHGDMNLKMLHRSARSLRATFTAIASRSFEAKESIGLRESLSELGRQGERTMLRTTRGVNTHRGAIWTLGLLCAGAAMLAGQEQSAETICAQAARIARLRDSYTSNTATHGQRVHDIYGMRGARGEAEEGFRHIVEIGLPKLRSSRREGLTEEHARRNALIAIMGALNDTCLLHRGGLNALAVAKRGAKRILALGGVATTGGSWAAGELDRDLLRLRASPGGSADLLAGVLFLDLIEGYLARSGGNTIGNITV
jgi:triphosphoribosyl-dephospho-CoA synthase